MTASRARLDNAISQAEAQAGGSPASGQSALTTRLRPVALALYKRSSAHLRIAAEVCSARLRQATPMEIVMVPTFSSGLVAS